MCAPIGFSTTSQILESDCTLSSSFPARLDTATLIFMWYLIFITTTTENLAPQRHDVINRKVVQSNIQTVNYFELVVHAMRKRY